MAVIAQQRTSYRQDIRARRAREMCRANCEQQRESGGVSMSRHQIRLWSNPPPLRPMIAQSGSWRWQRTERLPETVSLTVGSDCEGGTSHDRCRSILLKLCFSMRARRAPAAGWQSPLLRSSQRSRRAAVATTAGSSLGVHARERAAVLAMNGCAVATQMCWGGASRRGGAVAGTRCLGRGVLQLRCGPWAMFTQLRPCAASRGEHGATWAARAQVRPRRGRAEVSARVLSVHRCKQALRSGAGAPALPLFRGTKSEGRSC